VQIPKWKKRGAVSAETVTSHRPLVEHRLAGPRTRFRFVPHRLDFPNGIILMLMAVATFVHSTWSR